MTPIYSNCSSFTGFQTVSVITYGYGSIPINTIFRGLFTSINPSYFDVNYRGTRFWPTAIWSFFGKRNEVLVATGAASAATVAKALAEPRPAAQQAQQNGYPLVIKGGWGIPYKRMIMDGWIGNSFWLVVTGTWMDDCSINIYQNSEALKAWFLKGHERRGRTMGTQCRYVGAMCRYDGCGSGCDGYGGGYGGYDV